MTDLKVGPSVARLIAERRAEIDAAPSLAAVSELVHFWARVVARSVALDGHVVPVNLDPYEYAEARLEAILYPVQLEPIESDRADLDGLAAAAEPLGVGNGAVADALQPARSAEDDLLDGEGLGLVGIAHTSIVAFAPPTELEQSNYLRQFLGEWADSEPTGSDPYDDFCPTCDAPNPTHTPTCAVVHTPSDSEATR